MRIRLPGRLVWTALLSSLATGAPVIAAVYTPPVHGRADLNLNGDWRFVRQDVPGAEAAGFDDSGWTELDLPHTWNNLDGQDGGNNYYRGPGWYRRALTVDSAYSGKRFFLKFDGANLVTEAWVNGAFVGRHEGGYAAFVFDVTPHLAIGTTNVLAVRVNNAANTNIPPLSADFTFFGGIYREVHLLVTEPVHITPLDHGSPGVYLKTTNVSSNAADLEVTTVLSNATASARSVAVRSIVTDPQTNIVAVLSNWVTLPAGSMSAAVSTASIANPHLWNGPADPFLYRAWIEVVDGTSVADLVVQPLGFRYFAFDPNTGFWLNGRSLPLRGVNMHQDWLNRGWALGDAERQANFDLIREMGANTIRLAHYQHAEHTYALADATGLLLWTEIPLVNRITESPDFYENSKQQLRELIRQNYNHPSVICWGLFNEITLSTGPTVTNLVAQLAQLARQEDPTRPSTAASAASDSHPSNWYSDIVSFNKYYGWYGGNTNGFGSWANTIHANYPTRCIGLSEYGAGASIWQHSENPSQPTPAGPFHPEEWQNLFHESYWLQIKTRPFLWATHIWNMFDFGVDGRNEGDTSGRNDKGLVTYDRQVRKDAFYWYKANWTTNPMVYITGHTFTNRKATSITARVYANCDTVELYLNGVSLGAIPSANRVFTWPLTLLPGSNFVSATGTLGTTTVTDSLTWTLLPEPFRSAPLSIPGRIQGEEFDGGPNGLAFLDSDSVNTGGAYRTNDAVDIEACGDTGLGYNVTQFRAGEWLGYAVKIASTGTYDLLLRVSCTNTVSRLRVDVDGQPLGEAVLPNTGGAQNWQTLTITNLPLKSGSHQLRLECLAGEFRLNWLEFAFKAAPAAFVAKINFQTNTATLPAGYLRDGGLVFGDRGGGYSYGWNIDNTGNTRERNSANSPDKRYDTLTHLQRGSNYFWEMWLPNGTYTLRAVSGDPGYTDSFHSLNAEDQALLSAAPASDRLWIEGAAQVTVSDGRLTIASQPNGVNSKLCFVELAESLGATLGWRFSYFGQNANDETIAGDYADPESDRLPNLVEYALNTNPLLPTSPAPWSVGLSNELLTVTFDRRRPPADVAYIVEVTDNLAGPWTELESFEVLSDNGVMQRVRVSDTVPPTAGSARFLRLKFVRIDVVP